MPIVNRKDLKGGPMVDCKDGEGGAVLSCTEHTHIEVFGHGCFSHDSPHRDRFPMIVLTETGFMSTCWQFNGEEVLETACAGLLWRLVAAQCVVCYGTLWCTLVPHGSPECPACTIMPCSRARCLMSSFDSAQNIWFELKNEVYVELAHIVQEIKYNYIQHLNF